MKEIINTLQTVLHGIRTCRQESEKEMYATSAFDKLESIEKLYKSEMALHEAIAALKEGFNV